MRPMQREMPEQRGVPVRPHARPLALRALVGVLLVVALYLLLWLTGWGESLWGSSPTGSASSAWWQMPGFWPLWSSWA